MSEEWGPWLEHNGRGCPCAGKHVESEDRRGHVMNHIAMGICVDDYGNVISRPATGQRSTWLWGTCPVQLEVVRYRIRNPRAASTKTGMAMLKEILDRETVEPVKRKVTT